MKYGKATKFSRSYGTFKNLQQELATVRRLGTELCTVVTKFYMDLIKKKNSIEASQKCHPQSGWRRGSHLPRRMTSAPLTALNPVRLKRKKLSGAVKLLRYAKKTVVTTSACCCPNGVCSWLICMQKSKRKQLCYRWRL